MAAFPEGAPCWVDASFPNVDAAKNFYSELFGWTFTEGEEQFGGYAQAQSDGRAVAGVMPTMPDQESKAYWGVYFATSDADAAAARIREAGGELLMEPMQVGDLGKMVLAYDPAGALFGLWQPGTHQGFAKTEEPGSFAWAEMHVRDTEAADDFYPRILPIEARQIDDAGGGYDYKVWKVGDEPVAGRMRIGDEAPADLPPRAVVYFDVADCDEAVATVSKLGGSVLAGPGDSPFGRLAMVRDPQGAEFAVIDSRTRVGKPPSA